MIMVLRFLREERMTIAVGTSSKAVAIEARVASSFIPNQIMVALLMPNQVRKADGGLQV